ncbi:hypothetical protein QTI17_31470 [Variovorax sp. J31P179]|nr:hypothetical protein [Variovorax sp. J31P179]MDM0085115.1 hypothetical protein [Variovorax sp. J31P179]
MLKHKGLTVGPLVLLLLAGSSKADQKAAIAQAAAYLKDWKEKNA